MKLKDLSSKTLTKSLFGFLLASFSVQVLAQNSTPKGRVKSSEISTNAQPTKAEAPASSPKAASSQKTTSADEVSGTGTSEVDPKTAVKASESSLANHNGNINTEATRTIELIRGRLTDDLNVRPFEFKGKSNAGHEFRVILKPAAKNELGPVAQKADPQTLEMSVEIYFDGALPIPITGRVALHLPNLVSGAQFQGHMDVLDFSRGLVEEGIPDPLSEIKLLITYNIEVGKFELKHFSIHAGMQALNPFSDSKDGIVFGGLDSGGGGK